MGIGYLGKAALVALYLLTMGQQNVQSQDLASKLKVQTAQSPDSRYQQFLDLYKRMQDSESNKLKSGFPSYYLSAEIAQSLNEMVNKLAIENGLEPKKYLFAFTFGESIVAGYQTMRRLELPDGYGESTDFEYLILTQHAAIHKTRKYITDNYEYGEFRNQNNNERMDVVDQNPQLQPIDPRFSGLGYTDLHQLIGDMISRRKFFESSSHYDTYITEYLEQELNAITLALGRMHGTDLQQCRDHSIKAEKYPKRIDIRWRSCGEGIMIIWPDRVVISKQIGTGPQQTEYLKPVIKTP